MFSVEACESRLLVVGFEPAVSLLGAKQLIGRDEVRACIEDGSPRR